MYKINYIKYIEPIQYGGVINNVINNVIKQDNNCQIFVKLKLNDGDLKTKLLESLKNFNLNINDLHITLLQIYVNMDHSSIEEFLYNRRILLKILNKKLLKAFERTSLKIEDFKCLGEQNYITLNLKFDTETFKQAKREFFTELNSILFQGSRPGIEEAETDFGKGKTFTFNNKIFYFIKDHYMTDENSNSFIPHISFGPSKYYRNINIGKLSKSVMPLNNEDFLISKNFSINSAISTHKNTYSKYEKLQISKSDKGDFVYYEELENNFVKINLINLIISCNSN